MVAVVCFSIRKALNMISIGNFEAGDEANIEMPSYSAPKKDCRENGFHLGHRWCGSIPTIQN